MHSLVFFHNNQWQSGNLLKSSSKEPQLFWFFFDTHLLPGEVDQYLCFVLKEDKVAPAKSYAKQYHPLVEGIQKQIEQLVQREKLHKGR